MNVKLIRMWSGEDVVADVVKENEDTIVFINPIVAVPTGQGQMGFVSLVSSSKRERIRNRNS